MNHVSLVCNESDAVKRIYIFETLIVLDCESIPFLSSYNSYKSDALGFFHC